MPTDGTAFPPSLKTLKIQKLRSNSRNTLRPAKFFTKDARSSLVRNAVLAATFFYWRLWLRSWLGAGLSFHALGK